jgi:membrane protease YdiL (CAAX protease family)
VPIIAFRTRARFLRRTVPPNRVAFYSGVLVQFVLFSAFSIAVAAANHIELFPRRAPSAEHAALGFIVLVMLVAVMRPHWKRAVLAHDRVLWLFMPANRDERMFWMLVSLLAGFSEEITWRAVQTTLLMRMTHIAPLAIGLAAFTFAITHALQGWKSVVYIGGFALIFHGLVIVTGSLYVAMAVHFLYDLIAGLTYAKLGRELGYSWS